MRQSTAGPRGPGAAPLPYPDYTPTCGMRQKTHSLTGLAQSARIVLDSTATRRKPKRQLWQGTGIRWSKVRDWSSWGDRCQRNQTDFPDRSRLASHELVRLLQGIQDALNSVCEAIDMAGTDCANSLSVKVQGSRGLEGRASPRHASIEAGHENEPSSCMAQIVL